MKNQSIVIAIPVITLLWAVFYSQINTKEHPSPSNESKIHFTADTVKFDQNKALQKLKEKIAGKEDQPAAEVFENIKVFKKVPAARLLENHGDGVHKIPGGDLHALP